MTTPTLNRMTKLYENVARIERLKCGRPNERTVRNTISGVRTFLRWINQRREHLGYDRISFDEDFPLVSIIKPKLIHQYLSDMLKQEIKPITAMSYLNQLRQLFAKWIMPYYEDQGWKVPDFPAFGKKPKAPRYCRPSAELLKKVRDWYFGMTGSKAEKVTNPKLWFIATMMLEFAMRNSDIKRLRLDNFVEHNGRIYLNYTPHKTEHSSGRTVKWPVHPDFWEKIKGISTKEELPELDDGSFAELNRAMRSFGFTGSKGAYELRKICVDHVYQKFGAEMAVSISGDDIRTIMHYYADPAQPNIGEIKICELL